MLTIHLHLGLEALLAIAIATGVSAAEDNPDNKRCGGYYACIERQPAQPDSPRLPLGAVPRSSKQSALPALGTARDRR
jgi:hypothetical protein